MNAVAMMNPCVFDRKGLLDRLCGDEELYQDIATLFLSQVPQSFDDLQRAIDEMDTEAVARYAHSLKGMCGNMGAMEMSNIANELGMAAKMGDLFQMESTMPILRAAFAKFKLLLAS